MSFDINDEFCQKTGLFCCKMNVNVVIVFVKFRHEGSNSLKKIDETRYLNEVSFIGEPGTATSILERHGKHTSSSFVKIL